MAASNLLLVGVESKQRVCYSGPPPEPDPDNPDDRMKQVMQQIRKRCPGRRPPDCSSPQPLGMEDGRIPDGRIKASSHWGSINCCPAREARLNNDLRWIALSTDANPWIEVDLVESTVVTGVITQGSGGGSYVTQFKVAYQKQPSSDREHVKDKSGNVKVFIGNTDVSTTVTNLFDESVVAAVVRIEPTEWQVGVGLRLELLGCHLD
ncbi:retinoschisin-like [Patiria miniata]|uniref:F5/8 type C domain-containing protein n=1 Tax=Patiria miniata TaxID=46514 RepID=A0A914AC07_PATMI|nr:retinoschisin-like [Patiria miniata]